MITNDVQRFECVSCGKLLRAPLNARGGFSCPACHTRQQIGETPRIKTRVSVAPPRAEVPLVFKADAQDELVFALPRKRFMRKPANPAVILVAVGVGLCLLMGGGIAMMALLGDGVHLGGSEEDVPAIVQAAADRGEEVWELTGTLQSDDFPDGGITYIAVKDNSLRHTFRKDESAGWTEEPIHKVYESSKSTITTDWSFERTSAKSFVLTHTMNIDENWASGKGCTVSSRLKHIVDLDASTWSGTTDINTKFKAMAVPDKHETKRLTGGKVLRVKAKAPSQSQAKSEAPKTMKGQKLTKEEFRAKLKQMGWHGLNNTNWMVDKAEFLGKFGNPTRTSTLGERTYWTYNCRDGTITVVMVLYGVFNHGEDILINSVNDF